MADFQIFRDGDGDHSEVVIGPCTAKAALRISVIEGVPARSCTVSGWAAKHLVEKLQGEGFTFEEADNG